MNVSANSQSAAGYDLYGSAAGSARTILTSATAGTGEKVGELQVAVGLAVGRIKGSPSTETAIAASSRIVAARADVAPAGSGSGESKGGGDVRQFTRIGDN